MPHKISIITPVYNCQSYIGEAIKSVLSQTYDDWELIIVDDGSTDNTPEVVSIYQDEIIYLRQSNSGEGAARNAGLSIAKGDYLLFLDADDLLLPNNLETLSTFLDTHNQYGAVYSDGYCCDQDKRIIQSMSSRRPANYSGNILEKIVLSCLIAPMHCAMIRTGIVNKYKLQFDPQMNYGVDWAFWIQLAAHTKIGYVDETTCLYRIHGNNMTSTTNQIKRFESITLNRYKIMNSWFFSDLSVQTREAFFYSLLINYSVHSPSDQIKIIKSAQFLSLPNFSRARLLRLSASEALLNNNNNQARILIRESIAINYTDFKTILLFLLSQFPLCISRKLISFWRDNISNRHQNNTNTDLVAEAFFNNQ